MRRSSTLKRLSTAVSAALIAGLAVVAPTSAGAAAATGPVVFDDMEHGAPFDNGWFSFNGAVGGGGISQNTSDLPPADGGTYSLETGWGSGENPGFYGGFGRTQPTDTSGTDHFNFWINPNPSQEYTLEFNLQEDMADPDEFQFDCVIAAGGPCATSGGGWQLVSIPLTDFLDDNSQLPGGDGTLDPQLSTIVVAVIGTGSDVNFRTDYWAFSHGAYVPNSVIDDFESGLPSGAAEPNGEPLGFYTFQGDGSIAISTTGTPPAAPPAAGTPNNVLKMEVAVTSFAGYIHAFGNTDMDTWVTQDWSTSEGISFWMYGLRSGTQMFIDILDNRNPGSTKDDAERFTATFADDFEGWKRL